MTRERETSVFTPQTETESGMSERETGSGQIDCDQIVMTPGVI